LNRIFGLFVAMFLVVFLAGCGGAEKKEETKNDKAACACGAKTPAKADAKCVCADMSKAGHGWCEHCGGGMVDGKATTCKECGTAGKACAAHAGGEKKPG
jgi:hypothetical protein